MSDEWEDSSLDPVTDDPFNTLNGDIFIDDFDRGVITTMGACPNQYAVQEQNLPVGSFYVIKDIRNVSAPPGYEGVPVYFSFPDENIETKILPSIVIRRDGITPAMNRWHPFSTQYNVPAKGAHRVTVNNPITGQAIKTGYDAYETKVQAYPFDLLYTIQLRARYRANLRAESMRLLQYVMMVYRPYCTVYVRDTLDKHRAYSAFMETPSAVDIMPDIDGKEANFNITLRVEAELDLEFPLKRRALTMLPTINMSTL